MFIRKGLIPSILLIAMLLITSCKTDQPTSELPRPVLKTVVPGEELQPTPTDSQPDVELVARVNGIGIPLADYKRELEAYRAAFVDLDPAPSDEEAQQEVINYLIEQTLLVNAAHQAGFRLSNEALREKLNSLTQEIGGQDALNGWMEENFYTEESLLDALRSASESAHQRDLIIAQVPEQIEQVHARQIFSTHQGDLIAVERSLAGGANIDTFAKQYDPLTLGELGWFPRGYLLFPEIEEAAFSLPVGSTSEIIQTDIGYHILYIIAREEHPLSTDARVTLQNKALDTWLTNAKEQAEIEILIP